MISHSGRLYAACAFAMCSTATQAESFAVQPRFSTGVQNYSMGFEDVISPASNGGFDYRDGFKLGDLLSFLGGGVTVSKGRLFADLSGQWSGNGKDFTYQHIGNAIDRRGNTSSSVVGISNVFGQAHSLSAEFDRHEYNASIGWAFTSNFSVYAGYKRANVNMSQALAPEGFAETGDVLFLGDYDMRFAYDGAFVGATYLVPVRNWGAVSIQSSIAQLDGEFSEGFTGSAAFVNPAAPFGLTFIDPTFKDGEVTGKSTGFNIGLSFTGGFGWLSHGLDRLSYTIGIDRSLYKFDSGSDAAFWAADFEEANNRARIDFRLRLGGGE
ncbi:MAG: hypothetical protein ABIT36_01770 [Steroidobacteraceae bacterium]